MTYYINIYGGPHGNPETIDEFDGDEAGARYLLGEYRLAYGPRTPYRIELEATCSREWRERGR